MTLYIPPRAELADYFDDKDTAINKLIELEVLPIIEVCYECQSETTYYPSDHMCKCKRKNCRKAVSIMHGTLFDNSRYPANKVLEFGYLWLNDNKSEQIRKHMGCSKQTTANWIQNFQQLIELDLMATPNDERMIGGDGVVVQIDESKFGKRKHNRGHRVKGVWVVGGVEITNDRKCFFTSTDDRSAERLLEIIQRNVLPGSIIHTDCWGGYSTVRLRAMGMTHMTVNHTEGFVDAETGVHTNNIEATWRGIKFHFSHKHMNADLVNGGLFTFVWKRLHSFDLWFALLNAIKRVDYNDFDIIRDEDDEAASVAVADA